MSRPDGLPRHIRRIAAVLVPPDRRAEVLGALEEGHRARLERMDAAAARRRLWRELAGLAGWRLRGALPGGDRGRRAPRHDDGRAARTTTPAADFARDARFAARTLLRRPGFSLTAVAVMALGIGASTTVFSVVDAVFLRPPEHVAEPHRLVRLHRTAGSERAPIGMGRPDYVHYRAGASTVPALAAYGGPVTVAYAGDDDAPGQLGLGFVSAGYFDVLGTPMARGRAFLPEEDRTPGTHPVVVLGHAFWTRELGADPGVLGRFLRIQQTAYTVVGVAPEGFTGVGRVGPAPDAWTPLAMYGAATAAPHLAWWQTVPGLDDTWLDVVGRLAPGVTFDAARAELEALATSLPGEAGVRGDGVLVTRSVLYPPGQQAALTRLSGVLGGAVALVLAVAIANVALLLMARASGRAREMGVRMALGAGRARLTRQLLVESLLLASAGGALGVLLAVQLADLAGALLPFEFLTSFAPRWTVAAAAVALTLATALLAGLAPARHAVRADPARALRGGPSGTAGARLRRGLVVAQVALSMTLLSGAVLFAQSFWNARNQPLGFEAEDRLVVQVDLRSSGYGADEGRAFLHRALERVRGVPGVRAATAAFAIPFRGAWSTELPRDPEGGPGSATFRLSLDMVAPDYFRTLGVPILAGRPIGPDDAAAGERTMVVNEAFAELYWPGQDPVGRIVRQGQERSRVVGLARNATYQEFGAPPAPRAYLSLDQRWMPTLQFVVHADAEAADLAPAVRAALREIDPGLTFPWTGTLASVVEEQTAGYRVSAAVVGGFALAALALAAAGLYGVMTFLVAQRTREIGVRMALGADLRHVTVRFVSHGGRLVLTGIALGLAGALLARRFTGSLVFGVSGADPLSPLVAGATLLLVGVAAAWGPTRRAARVDPVEAMRTE